MNRMRLLHVARKDAVAILTLDDPAHRNALSLALARELGDAVTALRDDSDVRALVVTGTPPAFSAGADLADLELADEARLRAIYEGFMAVARFPLPTVAAVNGAAVGAGLNLALACDIRIAARSARFESRFLDLALHPGGGHTWMLRRMLGPQGVAAVVLCGEALDGEDAARRGLAWRCVDDAEVVTEAVHLARRAGSAPRELMLRLTRTASAMGAVADHDGAVTVELEQQLWSTEQSEFKERLQALRRRISGEKS